MHTFIFYEKSFFSWNAARVEDGILERGQKKRKQVWKNRNFWTPHVLSQILGKLQILVLVGETKKRKGAKKMEDMSVIE